MTIKQSAAPPDAIGWLRGQLDGRAPRLQRRLVRHASRAGISQPALRAAALALGVEIVGAASRLAFWRLP